MFDLAARDRNEHRDLILGAILSFVAGAINAGGYLSIKTYVSHMSGLVSSIADNLILGELGLAFVVCVYVLTFFMGASTTSLMVLWGRLKGYQSEFANVLAFESLLLLIFGILAAHILPWFQLNLHGTILVLCFIMGLQNALMTKISHAEIRTTHVTGLITDIGIETGRYLYERILRQKARFHPKKLYTLVIVFACFLGGGIIGAFVFKQFGFISVLAFSGLLAAIAFGPIHKDLTKHPTTGS